MCFFTLGSSTIFGADFCGQVVDGTDGQPIENASLTRDTDPAAAGIDHSANTTSFGMFRLPGIPEGTYTLRVERGGYVPHEGELVLAEGLTTATIELQPEADGPAASGPTRDVFVSVTDAMTGVPIQATVEAKRFNAPTGGALGSAGTLTTGVNGNGRFVAFQRDHYEFEVTPPPGWKPFTSPRVFLDKTHHASINLKPVKCDVVVNVTGYDPVAKAEGPLKEVFVELTGFFSRCG